MANRSIRRRVFGLVVDHPIVGLTTTVLGICVLFFFELGNSVVDRALLTINIAGSLPVFYTIRGPKAATRGVRFLWTVSGSSLTIAAYTGLYIAIHRFITSDVSLLVPFFGTLYVQYLFSKFWVQTSS